MFNAAAESVFCIWLFKDVTSVTCFAAPLVRERVKDTLTHLRSLEMLKKEREGKSTRKDTHGTAEVM